MTQINELSTLEELQKDNDFLRKSLKEFAKTLIRYFLVEKSRNTRFDFQKHEKVRFIWMIASSKMTGHPTIPTESAKQIRLWYQAAGGWWLDYKTFVPNEEWLPMVEPLESSIIRR